MEPVSFLVQSLSSFVSIYLALLFIRVILSWFPTIDWSNPFFSTLSQLTDPYLNLFRRFVPPLGGIDFSPLLAFLLLQFLQSALSSAVGMA
ncbi:YggT family protein [Leptolyngbya sp. FACHB-261]|uniref:YggT family protein n=1 Tax=Leptolyngbya sp. FACHB-261 TaxID=2692806 RepID=UPI0016867630|nr:YggT family protein [Leptolyngbya sp. FACHB-261]MBD2103204.1 YggT family protein [Leptolyngbya sp. FACHB-261]